MEGFKQFINVFGEELMVENAERALATTAADTGVQIQDCTVGPIFVNGHEKGGHEWLISCVPTILHKNVSNETYKNMTLLSPKIQVAPKGLFYQWLDSQKKLGGQHKVLRFCPIQENT